MPDDKVVQPLKSVIRMATREDEDVELKNHEKEREAFRICKEKIRKHGLQMKLIDAEYTFDNNKVLFYFTADGRIDFRELVKDLASVFEKLPARGHQDGEGAESVAESDEDLRCLRKAHVLSEE